MARKDTGWDRQQRELDRLAEGQESMGKSMVCNIFAHQSFFKYLCCRVGDSGTLDRKEERKTAERTRTNRILPVANR